MRILSRFDAERDPRTGACRGHRHAQLVPTMLSRSHRGRRFTVSVQARKSYGAARIAVPRLEAALDRFGPGTGPRSTARVGPLHRYLPTQGRARTRAAAHVERSTMAVGASRGREARWRSGRSASLAKSLSGDHQMTGYHERPELTAKVLRDGFVWTHGRGHHRRTRVHLPQGPERRHDQQRRLQHRPQGSGGRARSITQGFVSVWSSGRHTERWGEAVTACVSRLGESRSPLTNSMSSPLASDFGARRPCYSSTNCPARRTERSTAIVSAPRSCAGSRRRRDDDGCRRGGPARSCVSGSS